MKIPVVLLKKVNKNEFKKGQDYKFISNRHFSENKIPSKIFDFESMDEKKLN